MGYELAPGRHVTFEREEIAALRPDSTKAITVLDFVDLDEVDPVYFDKTYWLGPDGAAAAEPYDLLLEAMEERNRVAIGHVVMRNKGRLAAIRPMGGLLAMSTMRYADEVVSRDDIDELPEERTASRAARRRPRPPGGRHHDLGLGPGEVPEHLHGRAAPGDRGPLRRRASTSRPTAKSAAAPVIDLMAALRESVAAAKEKAAADEEPAPAKKPAKKAAAKKATG